MRGGVEIKRIKNDKMCCINFGLVAGGRPLLYNDEFVISTSRYRIQSETMYLKLFKNFNLKLIMFFNEILQRGKSPINLFQEDHHDGNCRNAEIISLEINNYH